MKLDGLTLTLATQAAHQLYKEFLHSIYYTDDEQRKKHRQEGTLYSRDEQMTVFGCIAQTWDKMMECWMQQMTTLGSLGPTRENLETLRIERNPFMAIVTREDGTVDIQKVQRLWPLEDTSRPDPLDPSALQEKMARQVPPRWHNVV